MGCVAALGVGRRAGAAALTGGGDAHVRAGGGRAPLAGGGAGLHVGSVAALGMARRAAAAALSSGGDAHVRAGRGRGPLARGGAGLRVGASLQRVSCGTHSPAHASPEHTNGQVGPGVHSPSASHTSTALLAHCRSSGEHSPMQRSGPANVVAGAVRLERPVGVAREQLQTAALVLADLRSNPRSRRACTPWDESPRPPTRRARCSAAAWRRGTACRRGGTRRCRRLHRTRRRTACRRPRSRRPDRSAAAYHPCSALRRAYTPALRVSPPSTVGPASVSPGPASALLPPRRSRVRVRRSPLTLPAWPVPPAVVRACRRLRPRPLRHAPPARIPAPADRPRAPSSWQRARHAPSLQNVPPGQSSSCSHALRSSSTQALPLCARRQRQTLRAIAVARARRAAQPEDAHLRALAVGVEDAARLRARHACVERGLLNPEHLIAAERAEGGRDDAENDSATPRSAGAMPPREGAAHGSEPPARATAGSPPAVASPARSAGRTGRGGRSCAAASLSPVRYSVSGDRRQHAARDQRHGRAIAVRERVVALAQPVGVAGIVAAGLVRLALGVEREQSERAAGAERHHRSRAHPERDLALCPELREPRAFLTRCARRRRRVGQLAERDRVRPRSRRRR